MYKCINVFFKNKEQKLHKFACLLAFNTQPALLQPVAASWNVTLRDVTGGDLRRGHRRDAKS